MFFFEVFLSSEEFSFLPMTRFPLGTQTQKKSKRIEKLFSTCGRVGTSQKISLVKPLESHSFTLEIYWHFMECWINFVCWIFSLICLTINLFFSPPLNEHTFHKIFLFTAYRKEKLFCYLCWIIWTHFFISCLSYYFTYNT